MLAFVGYLTVVGTSDQMSDRLLTLVVWAEVKIRLHLEEVVVLSRVAALELRAEQIGALLSLPNLPTLNLRQGD